MPHDADERPTTEQMQAWLDRLSERLQEAKKEASRAEQAASAARYKVDQIESEIKAYNAAILALKNAGLHL